MRLFFALWPDDAVRAALVALAGDRRRVCGGRAPPVHNLHMTLAFLGNVPAARLPELENIAAGIATQSSGRSFMLTLDCIGWWRQSRLVWAGTLHCPHELEALAAALAAGLQASGFRTERRRFRPHVTLLRDAERKPVQTACGPVHWSARQFVLACSQPAGRGVEYRIVGQWPLENTPAAL